MIHIMTQLIIVVLVEMVNICWPVAMMALLLCGKIYNGFKRIMQMKDLHLVAVWAVLLAIIEKTGMLNNLIIFLKLFLNTILN